MNQAKTDDGYSPLYIACDEGHEAVVKRLLAHDKIDVNQARTSDGYTVPPLYTSHASMVIPVLLASCLMRAAMPQSACVTMAGRRSLWRRGVGMLMW